MKRRIASRVVPLTKYVVCRHCGKVVEKVQRIETETHVELFCLNPGCGVMVVSKPKD